MTDEKDQADADAFWSDSLIARFYRSWAQKRFAPMHAFMGCKIGTLGSKRVLDIACGPGDFLKEVQVTHPDVAFSGTDNAAGMVAYARKRLEHVRIEEAPSESQPFSDDSFDTTLTSMAFHHFPHPDRTLQEVRRILEPNGVYIIADTVARSDFQKRLWNRIEGLFIRGYIGHYTESDMRRWAEAASFTFAIERIPSMGKRYRLITLTRDTEASATLLS